MADTVRDVLVRLKMEIVDAVIQAPDITQFTKQLEEQNSFARQQAELIDEIVKRQEARDDASAKAAEVERKNRADAAAALAIEKKAEDDKKAADAAAVKAEKAKQDAINATNQARDAAIAKDRLINDSLLKTADSLKTGADGAFAFARGLTLIGFEGSSSFEEVARQVASVQAKFDLFRGSVDIIKAATESTRAMTVAIVAAGGAVQLLQLKLTALAVFLGPTGQILVGVGAATAALVTLFEYIGNETDDFLERTQEALDDFVTQSELAAERARGAFDKQDAIRATLEGDAKIEAINTDLGNITPGQDVETIMAEASARFAEAIAKPREAEELAAILAKNNAETQAAFQKSIDEQQRRQDLLGELLTATSTRDNAADRGRETEINKSTRSEEQTAQKIQKAQDDLRAAQEAAAEKDRQIAIERASLSGGDQAFVSRTSGKLGTANVEELKQLASLAPAQFGQDVQDELTRRGGGTPAERVDREAELTAELAALTAALKGQQTTTAGLRSTDSTADAEALAAAEGIRKLLRGIAGEVEELRGRQATSQALYEESLPE